MTAEGGVDPTLANKCLDLCQALLCQGMPFTISISMGSFNLSLDTRKESKDSGLMARKKPSPSTLRRNARRRQDFLKRKEDSAKEPVVMEEPVNMEGWCSELVDKGSESRSVTVRLKKKPPKITQLDGHLEEVSSDAQVQTEETKTSTKAVQTIRTAAVLGFSGVSQTNTPRLPEHRPYGWHIGPYVPPHRS